MRQPSVPLVIRAALMICAMAMPGIAAAEVPADASGKAAAAATEFAALAGEAQANGTVPHWNDPKAQAVLARLVDPASLGAPPYSAKDMPALDAVVSKVRASYQPYVAYMRGAKSAPDMQARAMAMQDELARFSAFFLRAQGAVTPALADFVAHLKPDQLTAVRLQGLRQMRLGITQMVQGAGMMARGGMGRENQRILVDAVADSAAPIAAGLSMTARAQVAEQLHLQFTGLPAPLQARIDAAGKAMASSQCSGLCTLE